MSLFLQISMGWKMCQDVDQVCAGAHSGRGGPVKKKEGGG